MAQNTALIAGGTALILAKINTALTHQDTSQRFSALYSSNFTVTEMKKLLGTKPRAAGVREKHSK